LIIDSHFLAEFSLAIALTLLSYTIAVLHTPLAAIPLPLADIVLAFHIHWLTLNETSFEQRMYQT